MQNLAQSAISAATFGAGNALLLPIGIPFVMGRPDLVVPMFVGVFLAMLVDGYMLYRMFDSEVFPARRLAAGRRGRRGDPRRRRGRPEARRLGVGVLIGVVGSLFKIPMSAFGVAFIGNIWALIMFGVGLLGPQLLAPICSAARCSPPSFPGGDHRQGLYAARLHGRRRALSPWSRS